MEHMATPPINGGIVGKIIELGESTSKPCWSVSAPLLNCQCYATTWVFRSEMIYMHMVDWPYLLIYLPFGYLT